MKLQQLEYSPSQILEGYNPQQLDEHAMEMVRAIKTGELKENTEQLIQIACAIYEDFYNPDDKNSAISKSQRDAAGMYLKSVGSKLSMEPSDSPKQAPKTEYPEISDKWKKKLAKTRADMDKKSKRKGFMGLFASEQESIKEGEEQLAGTYKQEYKNSAGETVRGRIKVTKLGPDQYEWQNIQVPGRKEVKMGPAKTGDSNTVKRILQNHIKESEINEHHHPKGSEVIVKNAKRYDALRPNEVEGVIVGTIGTPLDYKYKVRVGTGSMTVDPSDIVSKTQVNEDSSYSVYDKETMKVVQAGLSRNRAMKLASGKPNLEYGSGDWVEDLINSKKKKVTEGPRKSIGKRVSVVAGDYKGKTGQIRSIKRGEYGNLGAVKLDLDFEDGSQGVVYSSQARLVKAETNEAHGNSKEYDQCWDGYKKVPGKKRGEPGSCVKIESVLSVSDLDEIVIEGYEEIQFTMPILAENEVTEAEYQGRDVDLNKPIRSSNGPKKFHVYVKNDKGNVVKVNFGDPDMKIKKNIPGARKSFRARHKCDQKKDKTTAGYWSCKAW